MKALHRFLSLCGLCGLLALAQPTEATIKVMVFVSPVSFDTGGDTITVRFVVDIGDGRSLATHRTVAASAISNPATVITSIKNLVITFMANQYSQTIVASEILVFGAPQ